MNSREKREVEHMKSLAWDAGFLCALAGAVKSGVDPKSLYDTASCAGITKSRALECSLGDETMQILTTADLFVDE